MGCKIIATADTCFCYLNITAHMSINVCECLQVSGYDDKRHSFSHLMPGNKNAHSWQQMGNKVMPKYGIWQQTRKQKILLTY